MKFVVAAPLLLLCLLFLPTHHRAASPIPTLGVAPSAALAHAPTLPRVTPPRPHAGAPSRGLRRLRTRIQAAIDDGRGQRKLGRGLLIAGGALIGTGLLSLWQARRELERGGCVEAIFNYFVFYFMGLALGITGFILGGVGLGFYIAGATRRARLRKRTPPPPTEPPPTATDAG